MLISNIHELIASTYPTICEGVLGTTEEGPAIKSSDDTLYQALYTAVVDVYENGEYLEAFAESAGNGVITCV
eukprot:146525-Amorphochlora_amoeboformis.AAC.1